MTFFVTVDNFCHSKVKILKDLREIRGAKVLVLFESGVGNCSQFVYMMVMVTRGGGIPLFSPNLVLQKRHSGNVSQK